MHQHTNDSATRSFFDRCDIAAASLEDWRIMSLEVAPIAVGDYVRSLDFEDRADAFIEGTVEEMVMLDGCLRYAIRPERSVADGRETVPPTRQVFPPANGVINSMTGFPMFNVFRVARPSETDRH